MATTGTQHVSTGRQIDAGGIATATLLNQNYVNGAPYQWAIELVRNFEQALERVTPRGDERMVFDFARFEWCRGNQTRDPWKRRIWNTGPPMDPEAELERFFSTIAIGAGDRWSLENALGAFGKGSRASIVPHSDLMVITTQPGGDSTALMIVADDEGAYALANFVVPMENEDGDTVDEVEETVCVLNEGAYLEVDGWRLQMQTPVGLSDFSRAHVETLVHPEVMAKGGVTFILCGGARVGRADQHSTQDYVMGDARKGESSRSLAENIGPRYNPSFPIHTWDAVGGASTPSGGQGLRQEAPHNGGMGKVEHRPVRTYSDWIARVPDDVEHRGSVQLDSLGTVAEWYLLPEVRSQDADARFPHRGQGFVVAAYGNELMPLHPAQDTRTKVLRAWGVHNPDVAKRVGIIVRAPRWSGGEQWGVTQNESRSALTGPHGGPLPLADWQATFYDPLPEPILKALRAATTVAPEDETLSSDEVRKLAALIKGRQLDPARSLVADPDGAETGVPGAPTQSTGGGSESSGGGGAKRVPSQTLVPNQAGQPGRVRRRVQAVPEVHWLDAATWEAQGFEPDTFCEVAYGQVDMLMLNLAHPLYQLQEHYYTSLASDFWTATPQRQRLRSRVDISKVSRIIQRAYGREAVAKYLWIRQQCVNNGRLNNSALRERTTPERMTDALGGYVNVAAFIETAIGGLGR